MHVVSPRRPAFWGNDAWARLEVIAWHGRSCPGLGLADPFGLLPVPWHTSRPPDLSKFAYSDGVKGLISWPPIGNP